MRAWSRCIQISHPRSQNDVVRDLCWLMEVFVRWEVTRTFCTMAGVIQQGGGNSGCRKQLTWSSERDSIRDCMCRQLLAGAEEER